jgi:hypothetical protein
MLVNQPLSEWEYDINSVQYTLKKACSISLSTSCYNAVILSSCYKAVTHNLMTSCWIAGRWQVVQTTCNKSVELNNLVASCQQAAENLSTSWEQALRRRPVDKLLEQHCYKSACCRFVTSCAFSCVHMKTFTLLSRPPTHST